MRTRRLFRMALFSQQYVHRRRARRLVDRMHTSNSRDTLGRAVAGVGGLIMCRGNARVAGIIRVDCTTDNGDTWTPAKLVQDSTQTEVRSHTPLMCKSCRIRCGRGHSGRVACPSRRPISDKSLCTARPPTAHTTRNPTLSREYGIYEDCLIIAGIVLC